MNTSANRSLCFNKKVKFPDTSTVFSLLPKLQKNIPSNQAFTQDSAFKTVCFCGFFEAALKSITFVTLVEIYCYSAEVFSLELK